MPSPHPLAAALAAAIAALAAAACGLLGGSGHEAVTMYVAPETVRCKPLGEPESECRLVRSSPHAEWEPLVVGDNPGLRPALPGPPITRPTARPVGFSASS